MKMFGKDLYFDDVKFIKNEFYYMSFIVEIRCIGGKLWLMNCKLYNLLFI